MISPDFNMHSASYKNSKIHMNLKNFKSVLHRRGNEEDRAKPVIITLDPSQRSLHSDWDKHAPCAIVAFNKVMAH